MSEVKILFAGDYCPVLSNQELDKLQISDSLLEVIDNSDYSIVNMECPITDNLHKKIVKCGPHLKASSKGLDLLTEIGFKCVALANNHILDYGEGALLDTTNKLYKFGIDFLGAGQNLGDSRAILYKKISGFLIAFINCCEIEYSCSSNYRGGANSYDIINITRDIINAKKTSDYVFVFIHGGSEHCQIPSPRMQNEYRFLIEMGADAIINSHQHCYSGFEYYRDRPIVYGLGNFFFDKLYNSMPDSWLHGYIAELIIDNGKISIKTIPYIQCKSGLLIESLDNEQLSSFNERINEINGIIADEKILSDTYLSWSDENSQIYNSIITPFNNKHLNALFEKGFLPSFVSKSSWLVLKDMFTCRSHYDRYLRFIEKKISHE